MKALTVSDAGETPPSILRSWNSAFSYDSVPSARTLTINGLAQSALSEEETLYFPENALTRFIEKREAIEKQFQRREIKLIEIQTLEQARCVERHEKKMSAIEKIKAGAIEKEKNRFAIEWGFFETNSTATEYLRERLKEEHESIMSLIENDIGKMIATEESAYFDHKREGESFVSSENTFLIEERASALTKAEKQYQIDKNTNAQQNHLKKSDALKQSDVIRRREMVSQENHFKSIKKDYLVPRLSNERQDEILGSPSPTC